MDAIGEGTPIDRVLGETKAVLGGKSDRAAVVMFSDGLPTDSVGRDIGRDSSLEAARAVAAAYKGNVCFHTVQAGSDPAGTEYLLASRASRPRHHLSSTRATARHLALRREVSWARRSAPRPR